ncbi:MAG: tryptophan-rich sensory protein [Anaerolineae bacterium]
MNRNLAWQIVTVLAIAATIVVNILANALPIAGRTTADVSDSFDVLFVPAGYVFSIWGLIYLGLVAFAVYQLLPAQRDDARLTAIRPLVVLSCAANSVWIWFWHNLQFEWTFVLMLILLASLIAIYLRLGIGNAGTIGLERWVVDAVFSLYLGWISVATIANVTIVLDHLGWSGFGISDEVWAVALLAVGVLLAVLMAVRHADWIYALVLAWAFAGIGVSQSGTAVVTPAYLASAACVLCAAYVWLAGWRRRGAA